MLTVHSSTPIKCKTLILLAEIAMFSTCEIFLVLWTPELESVLQVESHESREEGKNYLPRSAGQVSFYTQTQDFSGPTQLALMTVASPSYNTSVQEHSWENQEKVQFVPLFQGLQTHIFQLPTARLTSLCIAAFPKQLIKDKS